MGRVFLFLEEEMASKYLRLLVLRLLRVATPEERDVLLRLVERAFEKKRPLDGSLK